VILLNKIKLIEEIKALYNLNHLLLDMLHQFVLLKIMFNVLIIILIALMNV